MLVNLAGMAGKKPAKLNVKSQHLIWTVRKLKLPVWPVFYRPK
jgi:hypothetical protein